MANHMVPVHGNIISLADILHQQFQAFILSLGEAFQRIVDGSVFLAGHVDGHILFRTHTHQLNADGTLTHTEWISTDRVFPNFDFVRALKHDLEEDSGTIFRYSHHENSVLNQIAEQLRLSQESDKEELITFIQSITHDTKEGCYGERDPLSY